MRAYSPFERRLRRVARAGLYGSLVLIGLAAAALFWWAARQLRLGVDQSWKLPATQEREEVGLLQQYLRVDTSVSAGSVVRGAEFLARQLEAMGLQPQLERLGERHANLWAVLEGEEPGALVLHNHIDVSDPGDLERWAHPPFAGVIDGPFLYGRGAFDMKSLTVAQLLALADQARTGRRPRRSLIFLATGSEEAGSELGTRWVLARHPALADRFWAVLTEGGVVEPVSTEAIKYWGIEYAQKRYAYGWACSPSRERLEALREELAAWQRQSWQPRLHPTIEPFVLAYGPSRDRPARRSMLERVRGPAFNALFFASQPRYLRALFLDEIHASPVEEDPTGGFRMRLLVHLLPDSQLGEVEARLLPDWMIHDVQVDLGEPVGAPAASPLDHLVYRTLEEATRRAHPEAEVGPQFLSWSVTDARFFRERGIAAYGYSPFAFFNLESLRADRGNERINLQGYIEGVGLYRDLVDRLVR